MKIEIKVSEETFCPYEIVIKDNDSPSGLEMICGWLRNNNDFKNRWFVSSALAYDIGDGVLMTKIYVDDETLATMILLKFG